MEDDYKKNKVIEHLKKVGFEDERIGMILEVIPIDDAYRNLIMNKRDNDRWNDCDGVTIIYRATKEERDNLTREAYRTMLSNLEKIEKEIKLKRK